MKNKVFLVLTLLVLLTLVGIQSARSNAAPLTFSPEWYPPELYADPYEQTVYSSTYRGVWDVYIDGGTGSYCITVTWGDSCGSYKSCGYIPGHHYQFVHDFNCDYGNHTFSQQWMAEGTGGPVYYSTRVYKIQ
jgi:hypothetical protein